jgi:acyl carrier protein
MLPAQLIVLDRLPLTPSGKLDRRALPDPEWASRGAYVAPESELERELARLWQDVLGVDRVGRNDDFFELGGHSLLATQLVSRVKMELGISLPLRAVFEASRLDALAARLDAGPARLGASELDRLDDLISELEAEPS